MSIILFFLLYSQISLGQTKNEIKKFKIFKIEQTVFFRNNKKFYTKYFNDDGEIVKDILVINKPFFKSVTTYKYLDSLCMEQIDESFEGNNKPEIVTTKFQYQFDNFKRIIQQTTSNSQNNILIEKYSYDNLNRVDTTFIFDNDTTVFEKGSFLNFKIETKPQPSLKKIKFYSYPDENKVLIKDCKYPISEKSCNFIEEFSSDSLIIHQENFYAVQGCVENHFDTFKKWHKKDGLTYIFESSDFDDKTYYFYLKNQFGLVVEERENNKPTKTGSKVNAVWKYYFRP